MDDKREHQRIKRNITAKFYLKNAPEKKYYVSQIIDISNGGLKFFTYEKFKWGDEIVFEVYFPFLYPRATFLEGRVVGIKDIMVGKTAHVSVEFINMTPALQDTLATFEKFNKT